ncbi:MAG: hypothetical protein LBR73_06225 [Oscillospiraceae bacterium]|nr:hypothetical protein [Oscillospiraceae bacterium]
MNVIACRIGKHSGAIRQREFFCLSPKQAYDIFFAVADLRGDADGLELVGMTVKEEQEEAIAERRQPFRFASLDVPMGAQLTFVDDKNFVATVRKDNQVEYEGKNWSPSALAAELYHRAGRYETLRLVQGPAHFEYEGEKLKDRRHNNLHHPLQSTSIRGLTREIK